MFNNQKRQGNQREADGKQKKDNQENRQNTGPEVILSEQYAGRS